MKILGNNRYYHYHSRCLFRYLQRYLGGYRPNILKSIKMPKYLTIKSVRAVFGVIPSIHRSRFKVSFITKTMKTREIKVLQRTVNKTRWVCVIHRKLQFQDISNFEYDTQHTAPIDAYASIQFRELSTQRKPVSVPMLGQKVHCTTLPHCGGIAPHLFATEKNVEFERGWDRSAEMIEFSLTTARVLQSTSIAYRRKALDQIFPKPP